MFSGKVSRLSFFIVSSLFSIYQSDNIRRLDATSHVIISELRMAISSAKMDAVQYLNGGKLDAYML